MNNYRCMTNEELIRDAEHKDNEGALVPIAKELCERLRIAISRQEGDCEFENEVEDKKIDRYEDQLVALEDRYNDLLRKYEING